MKISLLLVFAFSLSAAASVNAQRIDLKVDNATIKNVLMELTMKTGYNFVFKENEIANAPRVSLHVKDKDINQILPLIFADQPLTYTVKGKVVSIKAKKKEIDEKKATTQQDTIRGVVTDSLGNPLAGVAVRIVGTHLGVATNSKGQFAFPKAPEQTTLSFSMLGYETLQTPVTGPETNIVLRQAFSQISEVEINAGYWTVSDKLRTGNISKVDGETIRQQPVSDPMLALAGRVPGLQISQVSGLPGANYNIRLRGTNSIANGNDPLFIIDGVPFTSNTLTNTNIGGGATQLSPFALINAEEIESIEVLKDADATAIYGSRGANGVILITTKKGQIGQTQFNVNAYTGAGKVTRMLDLLNTEQYLEMRREAFRNDGVTNYPANAYDVNGTWDTTRYTDWQDVFIGNTAHMSNVQAQISGGTGQTRFTAGGGLQQESTVFPGDYKTNKASANFNINHRSVNGRFGVTFSGRYLHNSSNQPKDDFSINFIYLAPNAPALYDDQGNLNWENNTWSNPFAQLNARARAISKNIIGNGTLDYQIIEGLQAKLNLGYNELGMDQSIITPSTAFNPANHGNSAIRSHLFATNRITTWIIEPQVNFHKQIWGGNFEATFGTTFQETKNGRLAQRANDFTDDALIENLAAAAILTIPQNQQTEYRYTALFGRLHYNWQDKYLLNLVARRDGSSRFAPNRRYGNFASIGASWLFSNEQLFSDSILSTGKLRTSYGVTGNDQLSDYQYLSTYSSYNPIYLGTTGLFPSRLYSPDYGWEAVRKFEVGLDIGFIQDRISASAVYYQNRTDNQLVGYPLPTMTGFSSIIANLPAVIQNSGWEIELNTTNISKPTFSWNSIFNLSLPRNKLLAYPDLENSSYRNSYEVGKPLSIQKKWHWTGVDPETGIHTFEDFDGDGTVSSPQDLQPLVNTGQLLSGGFLNSFTFHGFQLDAFFHFVKRTASAPLTPPGSLRNEPTWVFLNRWQQPGDITDVQRFTQSGPAFTAMLNGRNNSDMIYRDASFIRLKNVSLSYQLPASWIKYMWMKQCRIYMQGQNLLTFTKYDWLDPETLGSLPSIRMITAGINLTL